MKKIGGLFLALLTFFGSTLNVFADAVEEVVEEKTQTIDKKDYKSLKDEVEKKVFELNKKDDGYVYDFEISITEEKEDVVLPPNTGVEINFFLEGALLISILVAAISLKKLCK